MNFQASSTSLVASGRSALAERLASDPPVMFVVMTADDRRLTTIFFGSSHATVQGAASAIATAYDRAVRMQDGWDRYGFHGCKIMAWSYADEVAWYRSGKKKGGVA